MNRAGGAKRLLRRAGISRSRAAAVRMCCERNALALTGPRPGARSRILCYHSVGTPAWGVNDVQPRRFRQQLEWALDAGYRFVPADLLASEGGNERRLAITFDDGLASVARNAAPVLQELGIPWTMFVVSEWAEGNHDWGLGAMMTWRDVEWIAARGATIGSHSATHPDFGRTPPEAFDEELAGSRERTEARTGIRPSAFAIPFGQAANWTPEAGDVAKRAGYAYIYAQSEERRPAGTVARTFITRFDRRRVFEAALDGAFDRWEEWL